MPIELLNDLDVNPFRESENDTQTFSFNKPNMKSSLLKNQADSQGNLVFRKSRMSTDNVNHEPLSQKLGSFSQSKSFERLKSTFGSQMMSNNPSKDGGNEPAPEQ